MLDMNDDWKGEHFIRHQKPEPEPMPEPVYHRKTIQPTKEQIAARRKKVRELMKAGLTAHEVARSVGTRTSNVYKDAEILGLTFKKENAL